MLLAFRGLLITKSLYFFSLNFLLICLIFHLFSSVIGKSVLIPFLFLNQRKSWGLAPCFLPGGTCEKQYFLFLDLFNCPI